MVKHESQPSSSRSVSDSGVQLLVSAYRFELDGLGVCLGRASLHPSVPGDSGMSPRWAGAGVAVVQEGAPVGGSGASCSEPAAHGAVLGVLGRR